MVAGCHHPGSLLSIATKTQSATLVQKYTSVTSMTKRRGKVSTSKSTRGKEDGMKKSLLSSHGGGTASGLP